MYSFLPLAPGVQNSIVSLNTGARFYYNVQFKVQNYHRSVEAFEQCFGEGWSGIGQCTDGGREGESIVPVSRISGRIETRQMLFSLHSSLNISSLNNCRVTRLVFKLDK